jgi:hypothetical protein
MKPTKPRLLLALSLNALLALTLFSVWQAWPLPLLFPCTQPQAQTVILALFAALAFQILIGAKILPGTSRVTLGLTTTLLLLTFWLGFYPLSPLGFSSGRIPVLSGFFVTTRSRLKSTVAPGEILSLASGLPAAIEPKLLPVNAKCSWTSVNGGSLDDPQTCDTIYQPPQTEYDLLKIHIQPGCGLPEANAQLKISLLP